MEDGQVLLYSNSVNAREQHMPYPWLVFSEKIKVNKVFVRDSTGISDSALLVFGGSLSRGGTDGQLKMLDGYLEFFMKPDLAETYLKLKSELEKLIQKKLQDPNFDMHKKGHHLFLAVQELLSGDRCDGRFVFGREIKKTVPEDGDPYGTGGTNPKSLLQTLLMRAGYSPPKYKTKHLKTNEIRAVVEFKGMQFIGKACKKKQLAERDAAVQALTWLTGVSGTYSEEGGPSIEDSKLEILLGGRVKKKRKRQQT